MTMLNNLTPARRIGYSGVVEFNSSTEIGLSNTMADKPLHSGIFTSVNTIDASFMAGRSGGSFGCVGSHSADRPTLLRACHPDWSRGGGVLKPTMEAIIMPKHARTFFTYSLVAITTLPIERNTPIAVITFSLAALVLVHVIGGANHA